MTYQGFVDSDDDGIRHVAVLQANSLRAAKMCLKRTAIRMNWHFTKISCHEIRGTHCWHVATWIKNGRGRYEVVGEVK